MESNFEHLATGVYSSEPESLPVLKPVYQMNLEEVEHELSVMASDEVMDREIDIGRRDQLKARKEELE